MATNIANVNELLKMLEDDRKAENEAKAITPNTTSTKKHKTVPKSKLNRNGLLSVRNRSINASPNSNDSFEEVFDRMVKQFLLFAKKEAVYEDVNGELDEPLRDDLCEIFKSNYKSGLDLFENKTKINIQLHDLFVPHPFNKSILTLTRPKLVAFDEYVNNKKRLDISNFSVYIKKPSTLGFIKPQLFKLVESTQSDRELQKMTPCKFISYLEDKLHYQLVDNDDKRSITSNIIGLFNETPELRSYDYNMTSKPWKQIETITKNILLRKGLTIGAFNVCDIIDVIEGTIGESVLKYKNKIEEMFESHLVYPVFYKCFDKRLENDAGLDIEQYFKDRYDNIEELLDYNEGDECYKSLTKIMIKHRFQKRFEYDVNIYDDIRLHKEHFHGFSPIETLTTMKHTYAMLRHHMLFTLPTFINNFFMENSKPYGFYDDNKPNDYIDKFDDIDELIEEFTEYVKRDKHYKISKEDIDLYRAYSVDGDVFERTLSLYKQQLKRYNNNLIVSKRLTNSFLSGSNPLSMRDRQRFIVEVINALNDKIKQIDGLHKKKNFKSYERVSTYKSDEPIDVLGMKHDVKEFTDEIIKHYSTKFESYYEKKFENAKNEDERLNHNTIQQLAFFLKVNEYVLWKNEKHVEIVDKFLSNAGGKLMVDDLREDINLLRSPRHKIKTKKGENLEITRELFELMTEIEKRHHQISYFQNILDKMNGDEESVSFTNSSTQKRSSKRSVGKTTLKSRSSTSPKEAANSGMMRRALSRAMVSVLESSKQKPKSKSKSKPNMSKATPTKVLTSRKLRSSKNRKSKTSKSK